MQTANNEDYELIAQAWAPDGPSAEEKVHQLLGKHRVYRQGIKGGTEWFKCGLYPIRRAVRQALHPQFYDD